MKRWIRSLFAASPRIQKSTATRTKLQDFLTLEDRVVPSFTIGLTSVSSTSINEGTSFTFTGTWTDTNLAPGTTPVTIVATPNISFGSKVNITGGEVIETYDGVSAFRYGSWSYQVNVTDGGVPPDLYKLSTSVTNGTADPALLTPELFNFTAVNISPSLAGPADQSFSVLTPSITLGSFGDPGADSLWTVEVDFDDDSIYETSFTMGSAGTIPAQSFTYSFPGVYTASMKVTDKDGADSAVNTFVVTIYGDTSYVNDDWALLSNGTPITDADPTVPGNQPGKVGYNAFGTITEAVALTAVNGTIKVQAGTYAESPIMTKAVSVIGPNVGTAGDDLARVTEAVVTSPVADLFGSVVGLFSIKASNVTVDGFTFDGDNTLITGGQAVLGGADSNARRGIAVGAGDNVVVQNNRFLNFYGRATQYEDVAGDPAAGGSVNDNLFQNIGDVPGNDGYAMLVFDSTPSFSNNVSTNINYGFHYQYLYTDSTPVVATNNTLSVAQIGFGVNETGSSTGLITVANNKITVGPGGYGSVLWSVAHAGGITLTGNQLTGSGGAGSRGIYAWTGTGAQTLPVTGGFFKGFETGIDISNEETVGMFGNATAQTTLSLNGVSITPATDGTAIRVQDTIPGDKVVQVSFTGAASTINGSGDSTGLLLNGALANVTGLGSLTSFVGFTGKSQFIVLNNGAYGGSVLNASSVDFDGVTGGSATITQGHAIEDRLTHATDLGTGVGFIETVTNTVFTNALSTSGTAATASVNDHTALENSIDILGLSPSIRTVYYKGNFDYTEANTAASWAAAFYTVPVPGGINNLKLSAGALGDAVFAGPGDLTGANLEGLFEFGGGSLSTDDNQNMTISNLTFNDFDIAVLMYNSGAGTDAFNNLSFTNNAIRIPADSTLDVNQNIGLHYSFGKNQTISNNTIEIVGTGLSDTLNGKSSNSFAMQSNTSGGDVYDGLMISGNTITVTGAQSADPALIRGIWENAHAHTSNITVTNNKFLNAGPGNDPLLNKQTAFQITSQSGVSSTVTYSNNTIDGAKIGFEWRGASNFSGNQPVVVTGNTLTNVATGAIVQSKGQGNFSDNSFTNSGAMLAAGTGIKVDALASATISDTVDNNEITGFATGVLVNGSATITGNDASISGNSVGIDVDGGTATITGNHIYDNGIGIRFASSGNGSVTDNNFDDATDNFTDLQLASTAGTVTIGIDNNFAGNTFYIDNNTSQSYSLIPATGTTFDTADNYQIENRMGHRLDTDRPVTTGLHTWVTDNVYVTAAGTDHSIQRGVDAVPDASTGWTVNVEAGSYPEAVDVNEDVTLLGAGVTSSVTAPSNVNNAVFNISAPGVTLDGFGINIDQAVGVVRGVFAQNNAWTGALVQNNVITYTGAKDNTTRGIYFEDTGPAYASSVTIRANQVTSSTGSYVWRGIETFGGFNVVIGGATPADGNIAEKSFVLDVRLAFSASGSTNLIQNNDFLGGGVEVTEPNSGSTVTVQANDFIPAVAGYRQSLFINHNYSGSTVDVKNNNFTVLHGPTVGVPSIGAFLGGSKNVTLTNNVFTPDTGATNFVHLVADSQFRNGTNSLPATSSFTAQGNIFNGGSVVGGAGLALYNGDSGVGFGAITLGGAGALANSFGGNLGKFIALNSVRNPIFDPPLGGSPTLGDFSFDFDGSANLYDVGGGLELPAVMTVADKFALEQKLHHKPDSTVLGLITTTPNKIYVPNTQTIQGAINATPVAGINWEVIVQAGTYNEDIAMAPSPSTRDGLKLLSDAGASSTTIAGVVGGSALGVVIGLNQVIDGFTITRQDPADTPGENSMALSNYAGSTGYIVRNNIFTQNRTAIYVTGSGQGTYTRNVINDNRTGILFAESNNGAHSITENFITNNRTFGILFTPGALIVDSGLVITGNSITGNFATQLENDSPVAVNATGNWYGTNALNTIAINLNSDKLAAGLDGNGNPFSWSYPGPAVAPGAPMPYSISGTNLAQTDFGPYLWVGTDTDLVTPGFQGDFSQIGVTTDGGDFDGGTDYRVTEGVDYKGGIASNVHVIGGSYATDPVNLNRSVTVTLEGDATIGSLASTAGAGRVVDLNGKTLSAGIDNTSTVYNGTLTGTGKSKFVKEGTGTLTLTADNTPFTGALNVADGTVDLTGIVGGSASVTGTLTGSGSVLDDVTVNSGGLLTGTLTVGDLTNSGIVSPGGASVGTVTAASYDQTATGTLILDVNGPVISNDVLAVTGAVDLDGTLTVNSTGAKIANFQSIQVLTNAGVDSVTGGFTNAPDGSTFTAGANLFKIFTAGGSGNDVTLFTVPSAGPHAQTFADDNWIGYADGTDVSIDTGVPSSYIGYNSFAKIQPAIDQTTPTGMLLVYPGTYAADSIDTGSNAQTISLFTGGNVVVDGPLAADDTGAKVLFNKGSLTIGDGTSSTFDGQLSGLLNSTGFVKQGTGSLTLTNPANNYVGATKVLAGTLALGADEVIPNSSTVTLTGSNLDLDGYWETIGALAGGSTVDLGSGGKLSVGNTNTSTIYAGKITGTGEIIKQGAGTFTIASSTSDFVGSTTVEAGTLQLGNGGTTGAIPGDIQVDLGSTLAINRSSGTVASPLAFSNKVSGDGRVLQNGSGATRLTGANTFTGGLVASKGAVVAGTDAELGVGDVTLLGIAVLAIDGSFSTTRLINADTTAKIAIDTGKTLTMNGGVINGGTLNGPGTLDTTGGAELHGTIVGPNGVINASGTSTFDDVSNGGSLTLAASQSASMTSFANLSGGTLTINGSATADGFTNNGQASVAGTLTNTGATKMVFGGGSVTQVTAAGLVDVGATGAYASGALIRNSGAFGNATGSTTVDYGARFAAVTGSVDQNIVTQNGGVYAPGSSPGSSNSGAFNVNGGGTFEFELTNATGVAGALSGWDLVTVQPSVFTPLSAKLDLSATPSNRYVVRLNTRLNSGNYSTPGAADNFNMNAPYAWKFINADHVDTTISGSFNAASFQLDTTGFANATAGTFSVEARDGGKNLYIVYTPTSNVNSIVVNSGDPQRSRILSILVNFNSPVDAAALSIPGNITLTRTAIPSNGLGTIGTVVDTSTGLVVTPASGMVSSLTLTFANIDSDGIDYASLADGRWQLAIPSESFLSTAGDTNLRRLFGDYDNSGTVDAGDFGNFGNDFGFTLPGSAFDYDNNGSIDATDFGEFGARFGFTL